MNTLASTLIAIAAAAATSFAIVELRSDRTPLAPPTDNPDVAVLREEIESLRGQLTDVRAEVQSKLAVSGDTRTVVPQISDELRTFGVCVHRVEREAGLVLDPHHFVGALLAIQHADASAKLGPPADRRPSLRR